MQGRNKALHLQIQALEIINTSHLKWYNKNIMRQVSCTFHIFKLVLIFLFSSRTEIKTCYEKAHQLNNSVTRCNIDAGPALSAAAEKVWRDEGTEITIDCGMWYFWEHFYGMLCTLIWRLVRFMVASIPITVQTCSTRVFFCTDISYFDPTASTDRFLAAEKKVLY